MAKMLLNLKFDHNGFMIINEMEAKIKIDDKAMLRSGGPIMTVTAINTNIHNHESTLYCQWYDEITDCICDSYFFPHSLAICGKNWINTENGKWVIV